MPHVTRYTQDFTLSTLSPDTFGEYSQSLNFGPTHPKDNQLLKINAGCSANVFAREISLNILGSDQPLTIYEILSKTPETDEWAYTVSSSIGKEVIDTDTNTLLSFKGLSLGRSAGGITDENMVPALTRLSQHMAEHIAQLVGTDGSITKSDGNLLVQYLTEELTIIPLNQITCSESAAEMQYSETGLEITHSEL